MRNLLPTNSHETVRRFRPERAFTLLELLVVIVIIGILSSMAIPALKGFNESNTMAAATRQLMDDIAFARQKAMNSRTTVYMVFIPPNFWVGQPTAIGSLSASSDRQIDVPLKGQAAMYALFSFRSLGDQPGQVNNRYLTDWKELPEGVLIETNKFFADELIIDPIDNTRRFNVIKFNTDMEFPFPPAEVTNAVPKKFRLPYIAFDSQGKVASSSGEDEFIPLARGSVFVQVDPQGRPLRNAGNIPMDADIIIPGYRQGTSIVGPYNLIRIDRLTGRAKLERTELQ